MASLLTPHPLSTRLSAASSSSVALKRVLPPLACHARNLFDVLPQSDGNSDVVANGNPRRTEEGGAGSVSVPLTKARGGVTREASLSARQRRNHGARRWIRGDDRLVLGESTEGGVVQKGWTGGHGSTGGSEGRGRGRRWMRGGMRVQEPVKAGNLATSGEDRGVGNVSKRGKRSKGGERGGKLRVELDMCSKRGDVMGAIDLYDSALKEGVRMGQHHYNVLLYLCSSAALGTVQPAKSGTKLDSASAESSGYSEDNDMHEDPVHDQESNKFNLFRLEETTSSIPISDEIKEYAQTRGFEIFDKMSSEKERVQMSEAALTAVARMAMSMGNGDMAFETVKQMKELGIAPKLRSYGPALTAFCSSGDVDKAFEVEAHMLESGVIPEEPELGMLLSASVVARQGGRVYYLLHKFRTTVRQVSAVADAAQKRFPSRKWPLIVVHNRHLAGKHMKHPANQKLVQKWKQANAVYETPTGSNDDWNRRKAIGISLSPGKVRQMENRPGYA
ncbi:hypothetical protein ACQ4PT_064697 [Festuca glaucescens]